MFQNCRPLYIRDYCSLISHRTPDHMRSQALCRAETVEYVHTGRPSWKFCHNHHSYHYDRYADSDAPHRANSEIGTNLEYCYQRNCRVYMISPYCTPRRMQSSALYIVVLQFCHRSDTTALPPPDKGGRGRDGTRVCTCAHTREVSL